MNIDNLTPKEFDYLQDIEKLWRESQPFPTEKYLYETFRDGLNDMSDYTDQLKAQARKLIKQIKESNLKIDSSSELLAEFQKMQISVDLVAPLHETINQLRRIKRLARLSDKKTNYPNTIESNDKLERARQFSIIQFAKDNSLNPIKRGENFKLSCPFHKDKTPSMQLYIKTNSFHCFSCQKGGDVIKFCQETLNLSFPEALNHLTR